MAGVDMYEFFYDLKVARDGEPLTVESRKAMSILLHKVARPTGYFEINPLKIGRRHGVDTVAVAKVASWLVAGGFFVEWSEGSVNRRYKATEKLKYWLALPNEYIHKTPEGL